MLDLNQYVIVLKEYGFTQTHETKYAIEFVQESFGELVYINRKKASAALVAHPRHEHLIPRTSAISGVRFMPGKNHYRHNSNFRAFPKRINDKDPIGYGLEFVAESKEAASELLRLVTHNSGEPTVLDEIEEFDRRVWTKGPTERDAIIKARLGQGPWRECLDKIWGNCALTGCDIREMLRGSHIKPWVKSTDEERLDPSNGLLLRADIDALFDKGLLTFHDDGSIQFSCHLTDSQRKSLPFEHSLRLRGIPAASKRYLEFHRGNVFKSVA